MFCNTNNENKHIVLGPKVCFRIFMADDTLGRSCGKWGDLSWKPVSWTQRRPTSADTPCLHCSPLILRKIPHSQLEKKLANFLTILSIIYLTLLAFTGGSHSHSYALSQYTVILLIYVALLKVNWFCNYLVTLQSVCEAFSRCTRITERHTIS